MIIEPATSTVDVAGSFFAVLLKNFLILHWQGFLINLFLVTTRSFNHGFRRARIQLTMDLSQNNE